MSQFYGTLNGSARTHATRRGTKRSGIETVAASWAGAISVRMFADDDGTERYLIEGRPWHGHGESFVIAQGIVGQQPHA